MSQPGLTRLLPVTDLSRLRNFCALPCQGSLLTYAVMNVEPTYCNQVVPQLPSSTGPSFVYREAGWIDALGQLLAVALGLVLVAVALVSAGKAPWPFTLLFGAGAVVLVLGSLSLRTAGAPHFVVTAAGVFFPETGGFSSRVANWLLVPWCNVRRYRSGRLLDETTGPGVVLEVVASSQEAERFLDHRAVVLFPASAKRKMDPATVEVGYFTFCPSAEEVIVALRRHDGTARQHAVPSVPMGEGGRIGPFMG